MIAKNATEHNVIIHISNILAMDWAPPRAHVSLTIMGLKQVLTTNFEETSSKNILIIPVTYVNQYFDCTHTKLCRGINICLKISVMRSVMIPQIDMY